MRLPYRNAVPTNSTFKVNSNMAALSQALALLTFYPPNAPLILDRPYDRTF